MKQPYYKFIIQKDIHFISLLLLISFLFLFPLFHLGLYESHDGSAHIARFAAYYQAFQDGQLLPRWAGNLNFGYGTPLFIFYYPLPGYLASIIHLFGINFEDTFKLLISASFLTAPVTFYLWAKTLFRKEVAFVGALLYGFAPYHFLDLYVRGDVAELVSFAFVPIVFWGIEKFIHEKKLMYLSIGAVAYGVLVLSHNGVSLMFSPVFAFYALLRSKDIRTFFKSLVILFLGLLAAAWFWLPALYESKYTNAALFIGDMYKNHFPVWYELITSPWGFGADVRTVGGLSPQIGILPLLFVLGSIFILVKQKKKDRMILGWLAILLAAVFITLPLSTILWEKLPLLSKFEFPWRFTGLSSFSASVLGCYFLSSLKQKKILIFVVILILAFSIPFATVKGYVTHNDAFYQEYTGTTDYHGAASTLWTAGNPSAPAKAPIEIIAGKGIITQKKRLTDVHSVIVDAKEQVTILDNTQYFPGWEAYLDGKKVPIEFQNQQHPGLITVHVPVGKHEIITKFTESPVRLFADILSVIGVGILLTFWVGRKKFRL